TGASTAVNFVNSDGTFTFQSVSSNGASSGIIWNNSSAAAGSLTITGNGGTCSTAVNCTGGAIQNSSSHGVALTRANNVSFPRLFIQNTSGSGIKGVLAASGGAQVSGFTFQNGVIDNSGTGGGVDESNIGFNSVPSANETNLSGVVTIQNSTFTNSRYHGV